MMIWKTIETIRKVFFFFSCIYFFPGKINAQPADAAFRNITSADGLPTTSVTDVTQDAFGFIWIGSWDGAYRYDGRSFQKMTSFEARYLAADKKGGVWIIFDHSVGYYNSYTDSITKYDVPNVSRFGFISFDDKGTVWIETKDGVARFDSASRQFIRDNNQRSGTISELSAWGNGNLLFKFFDSKTAEQLTGKRNSKGEYTYEPYPFEMNDPQNEKLFTQMISVFLRPIDSTRMLVITQNGWAYKSLDGKDWVFKKPTDPKLNLDATDIKMDAEGNCWVSQTDALLKLNIITGDAVVYKHKDDDPNSLLFLRSNFIGCRMFIDRQGILWITRFSQGISCLNFFESDFGLLKYAAGNGIQDVLSAFEEKDGSYWIGSRDDNGGLMHFSADGKMIKRYGSKSGAPPGKTIGTELSHPFVWALAQTSDGSIWVGGGSPGPGQGGVSRIRPGSNVITRFKNDPNDSSSISNNWIIRVLVDGNDRVWLFTLNGGLCYIDPSTEKITREPGINLANPDRDEQRGLSFVTTSGDIIFNTGDFVHNYIIDHQTLTIKPFASKIPGIDSIAFTFEDKEKKIWFISPGGFGYLNAAYNAIKKIYRFDQLNFPITIIPLIMNADKKGNIWFGTDNGIIEFDPATEHFRHFGFDRGLQGNNFNQYGYKGPSGKIYFAGTGGVNIFDPEKIKSNPNPPEMIFTGLKLDGKSISFGDKSAIQQPIYAAQKITVDPAILTISIDFSAIHFAGYETNHYQYKLEGFDRDWHDGGSIGNATYTNLSPGKYILYIKGSNWDGVWSDGRKSIQIIVLPPWWQTWWAYVLYGLLFLFVLWSFYRYQRRRTIQKEREKTQQRELEQAKEVEKAYHELKNTQAQLIQSEKMASLGELTAGIAHEIQNPLNFVNNFSEVNKELIDELKSELTVGNLQQANEIADDIKENSEKINHHGKRADTIVKGMLQHSRSSSGSKEPTDINALCDEYLRLSFHGLRAKDKTFNAKFETDFDDGIKKINVMPQDIGRVILNLINNAFYASSAKALATADSNFVPTVWMSTKKDGNKILISVRDNGPGIPDSIKEKIFQPFFTTKPTGQGTGLGLSLSYDIIKAHGGEIKVNSKESEGTEFIIILPIS